MKVTLELFVAALFLALAGCGVLNPYVIARQKMEHRYFGNNYWNCWGRVGTHYDETWCKNGGDSLHAQPDLNACFNALYRTAKFGTSEEEAENNLIRCMQKKDWQFFGPPVVA